LIKWLIQDVLSGRVPKKDIILFLDSEKDINNGGLRKDISFAA